MSSNTIGDRIKALREGRGETQADVAAALYVKRQTVDQWENNETRDLKTTYTVALADYFNVTCDEILRGVKAENVSANKELGLSDKAIAKILEEVKHKDQLPFFNMALASNHFWGAIYYIYYLLLLDLPPQTFHAVITDEVGDFKMKGKNTVKTFLESADIEKLYTAIAKDEFSKMVDEIIASVKAENKEGW